MPGHWELSELDHGAVQITSHAISDREAGVFGEIIPDF